MHGRIEEKNLDQSLMQQPSQSPSQSLLTPFHRKSMNLSIPTHPLLLPLLNRITIPMLNPQFNRFLRISNMETHFRKTITATIRFKNSMLVTTMTIQSTINQEMTMGQLMEIGMKMTTDHNYQANTNPVIISRSMTPKTVLFMVSRPE